MLRKLALAGLMTATILAGAAPAQAQRHQNDGDANRRDARSDQRSTRQSADNRPNVRPEQYRAQQYRGNPDAMRQQTGNTPPHTQNRQQRTITAQTAPQTQRNDRQDYRVDRRDDRQDWRQDRRTDRQDNRQDLRTDRRDNRQDWRDDRRDDRADRRDYRRDEVRRDADRRDWNSQRRDWDNNRWNDGRRDRIDNRRRWEDQRRWDARWRSDRRYDWRSYRSRYHSIYRPGPYYAPRGWHYGYRSFSIGFYLSSLLYSPTYWLDDPWYYRLPPAYGSLRWVRYYDDALLVDIRDGYVVDVIRNFFW